MTQPNPLVEALETCRTQFAFYADQHRAKSPPDYAKAHTNDVFADLCAQALTAHRAAEGEPASQVTMTAICPDDIHVATVDPNGGGSEDMATRAAQRNASAPTPLVEALERIMANSPLAELDKFGEYNSACDIARKALSSHRAASTVTPQGAGDFRELSWQLVRQIGRMTHSQDDGASHDDDANDAMDALVASAREIMSLPGTAAQPAPPAEGWRTDTLAVRTDLRGHPSGPVIFRKGEIVNIVGRTGVMGSLCKVAHDDGRSGMWAVDCFCLPPAPTGEEG